MQPILCKDSANREQNINVFEYYAEMQPILCKDSANREQNIKRV